LLISDRRASKNEQG